MDIAWQTFINHPYPVYQEFKNGLKEDIRYILAWLNSRIIRGVFNSIEALSYFYSSPEDIFN